MTGLVRIVVADDDHLVRAGLCAILDSQAGLTVVGQAENGGQAVERVRTLSPDVVLMDVQMPGIDGIEATRQIVGDQTRVLMLTTFDLDSYVYAALKAGACGFLLKDTPAEKIIEAVRAAHRGDALLAPTVTRRLIEEFVRRPPPGSAVPERLSPLTPREREVLTLAGRGLSNTEIASRLFLSETTVKTHFTRVLAKLALRDRAQAVVVAYETGLVAVGET